jgi:four helix bundle protein
MVRQELEARLIDFVVQVDAICKLMPKSVAGIHFTNQIIRSSSSAALNYGEAMSAESKKDFIHKVKIVLKELRETFVAVKIIEQTKLCTAEERILRVKKENDELIAIFVKTVKTAQKNP